MDVSFSNQFGHYKKGESIAVNGVCLTIIDFTEDSFTVDLSTETLKRTSLGQLSALAKVNLEQSMSLDRKVSGHFVMGHVDCIGIVTDIRRGGGEVLFC